MADDRCICKGNWRQIIAESEPFFGRVYRNADGYCYRFCGVVHASDDYYYLLLDEDGGCVMATCVGSLETNGFELVESAKTPLVTPEEQTLRDIFGEDIG